jgi:hypothetical protein
MRWNTFFFRKQPVQGIALFRILFSIVLVMNALMILPNLYDYFGPKGMVEASSPRSLSSFSLFYFFSITQLSVAAVYGLHLLSAIMLLVGFFTRTSVFVAFVTLISLHQANFLVLHSGDTAMKLVLFLLVFSQAGDAFSLDAMSARGRGVRRNMPRLQAPWAQRLIQIQVSFIYFSTTFLKFDGEAWANGNAVYFTSRLWDFERFSIPYVFEHLWALKAMTWVSLFIEGALGTLIWFRPFRIPLIIIGILFHLVIEFTMNIPLFEWMMIALLVSMLEPREAYDFCQRMMRFGDRLRARVRI